MEILLAILGLIILFPLLIIYSAIVHGWVLSKLWLWFLVPIFGLQPLNITQAIGISIIVGFLTHQVDIKKGKDDKVKLFLVLINPFIILLFGYIVHKFM